MVDNSLFVTIFLALAGISIAAVALISLLIKYPGSQEAEDNVQKPTKLSELTPYKQSVGLLFLSFAFCVAGLLLSLLFSGINGLINLGNSWVIKTFNLVLLLTLLIFSLAFIYAAAGDLLRSILNLKGGLLLGIAPKFLKGLLYFMNNNISKIADLLTAWLFKGITKENNKDTD